MRIRLPLRRHYEAPQRRKDHLEDRIAAGARQQLVKLHVPAHADLHITSSLFRRGRCFKRDRNTLTGAATTLNRAIAPGDSLPRLGYGMSAAITRCRIGINTAAPPNTARIHRV